MNIPITGHTKLTALLGSPVSHSLSPRMHNEAFKALGLDYIYLCFDIKEEQLSSVTRAFREMGVRGFNLTMPNKNKMVEFADELSPAARLIGAVNTVVNDNGRFICHNTDGVGYMRAVKDAGYDITGKTITLLGGGGAATAICAQAALDGVDTIHVFLRKTSRFWQRTCLLAENIQKELPCRVLIHEQQDSRALSEALAESALLVNATSVGMAPNTEASLIEDPALFHPDLVVSDVIYNPQETRLLRLAREAGCRVFNGSYMLLYQGAEAFRLWTGQDMPVDLIKETVFA